MSGMHLCVSSDFFEYFKHCMFLGIHPCTFLCFILHSIFSLNSCRDFSLKFLLKAACLLKVLFLKLLLSYFLWCNASNTANNWRHAHPSLSSRFSVRSQGFNCAMKKSGRFIIVMWKKCITSVKKKALPSVFMT